MPLLNDAGKLNQRCTFYSMKETETARGTIKLVPTEEMTCWCTIRQARMREVQNALGTGHTVKTTLIIRHQQRKQVIADWTVKVKGLEYDIVSIIPDFETQTFDMIVLEQKF